MINPVNNHAHYITLLCSIIFCMPVFAESLNCPCKVSKVLNGDTVYVQDQYRSSRKIWMAGINAPTKDQNYGEQSRQNLIKLVLGQFVEVEYMQRDRYGRIIGKLIKEGQDINLQQIRDGYAQHYKQGKDEQSKLDHAEYSASESEAKQQQLGLWPVTVSTPRTLKY